jgi:tetratricopeptide (TPR) repeat protein
MIGYPAPVRQLLLLLLLATPASADPASAARPSTLTPEMDRLVMAGVDAIYRMDFDAADAAAKRAMALDPDYPHAYLGAAATDFIRYVYGPHQSDETLTKSFDAKVALAIAVSERWLKAHPNDPDALLVLGSGNGITARLSMERREWLGGYRYGSRAVKDIRASIAANPEQYDSYLGLGMFDYYVATIPRFAGWLAKIMLGGNRERGLREIRIAAEKGHFAKVAAQLILVEIDTQGEYGARNPAEAVRLMKEIRAKYPDSSMLHSAGTVALFENGNYDEGLADARDYLKRVQTGKYPPSNTTMARALTGTMLWAKGDKEGALAEFQAGSVVDSPLSRWSVWNRVRAGQLLDALGRRDEALAAYKSAYAEPDKWEFRKEIKPCLLRPCVGDKFPGRFSPN